MEIMEIDGVEGVVEGGDEMFCGRGVGIGGWGDVMRWVGGNKEVMGIGREG